MPDTVPVETASQEAVTLAPSVTDPEATLAPSASTSGRLGDGLAPPGYEILGELGRGGMGVVYKARQVKANRLVALKMILSGGYADDSERQRFRTEGEAVARLQHPGIVQVFEVGEYDGRSFFSLEFCAGGSLDRKLGGTPLPPAQAAALVQQVAQAVQVAHDSQVLHRDLKPANVMLTTDGTPKLTDFGLAKRLDETGQTATGSVMGTPSYMAPEQAEGKKDIGPRADVYSLGAILYECLTGRPPFKAATALDTIIQVVSEQPVSPRQFNVSVPSDLETICLKCLEKQPAKRYASSQELADDLRRYLDHQPIIACPSSEHDLGVKWTFRKPHLSVAVYLLVLLSGFMAATVAMNPADVAILVRRVWVEDLTGWLIFGGTLAVFAIVAVSLAVKSYRERVTCGFGLLRIAWVLPGCVFGIALLLVGLRFSILLFRLGPAAMAMGAAGAVASLVILGRSRTLQRHFFAVTRQQWYGMIGVIILSGSLVVFSLYRDGPSYVIDTFEARQGENAANASQWLRAVREFERVADQVHPSENILLGLLLAQVATENPAGVQQTITILAQRLEMEKDPQTAARLFWWAMVAPWEEPAAFLDHARKDLARRRDADSLLHFGIALYRAGQFTESEHRLAESVNASGGGGHVTAGLFLGMLAHRRGKHDVATQQLARFEDWHAGQTFPSWQKTVYYSALLSEARNQILGASSISKGASRE